MSLKRLKEALGFGISTPYPDKPWIKLRVWDGRFFVDVEEWAKTDDFKNRVKHARGQIHNL